MTVRLDAPERSAEAWLARHVSHRSRVIVGDQYWIYLVEHGFNDQPMRGGFFSDTMVAYWPLDYDPALRKAFPSGWREFEYIVVNEDMLASLPQTPSAAAAIVHSQAVASFGQGGNRVQIRKINPTGRRNPAATPDVHHGALAARLIAYAGQNVPAGGPPPQFPSDAPGCLIHSQASTRGSGYSGGRQAKRLTGGIAPGLRRAADPVP